MPPQSLPEPAAAALPLPRGDGDVVDAAALLGIVIPAACMPGVAANLALLAGHAATLRGAAQ